MEQVVELMKDIIRDPGAARNITVNIKECTLRDNSSVMR